MLLRRFNKSRLRVTAPNATEAERPFYERSRMVLHVTRRLLLELNRRTNGPFLTSEKPSYDVTHSPLFHCMAGAFDCSILNISTGES